MPHKAAKSMPTDIQQRDDFWARGRPIKPYLALGRRLMLRLVEIHELVPFQALPKFDLIVKQLPKPDVKQPQRDDAISQVVSHFEL